MIEKPTTNRTFTKRITVAVLLWAMGISTYTLIYQPDLYVGALAGILPFMIAVIGAYQGTGHADYRATLNARAEADHIPPEGFGEG
jgi:hypothetical protein